LANKKWLVQGQIDVALNENGRRQAVAAGKALRKVHFDSAYSSDLSRAVDTAKAIVQVFEDGE
jgi:broad specificity phosphatase PhoE